MTPRKPRTSPPTSRPGDAKKASQQPAHRKPVATIPKEPVDIFIRADASHEIGSGHIIRCLVLAEKLSARGHRVFFLSRNLPPTLHTRLAQSGCIVLDLPQIAANSSSFQEQDALQSLTLAKSHSASTPLLIIDHYHLDSTWETSVRNRFHKILVIDDLADRSHDCDFLLDVTWDQTMASRYTNLIPRGCRALLGPRYALLRDEFTHARRLVPERTGDLHKIFIFFGGADPTRESEKALEAISHPRFADLSFTLVTGGLNPRSGQIFGKAWGHKNIEVYREFHPIALLMAECDLAIGAGGSTSWERCALALPAIVICTAPNQELIAKGLHEAGAVWNLGRSAKVTAGMIADKLLELRQAPDVVRRAAQQAARIVPGVPSDGNGGIPGIDEFLELFTRSDS